MSGGHGGHGHGGIKHGDDHGHYPEEEILKEVGDRAYVLKTHEKRNLDEIESRLKSDKNISHHELHEYQHYLEHFTHHMKHILSEERAEHIDNINLEKELRRAAQLLSQVNSIIERHHH